MGKRNLAQECLKKYDSKIKEGQIFGWFGLGNTAFLMARLLDSTDFEEFKKIKDGSISMKQFISTGNAGNNEMLNSINELTSKYLSK